MKPTLGIIGAGKVGQTLARLLYQQGYTIKAVYSPHQAHGLAQRVDSVVTLTPREVLELVDLTLLTVPDDVIAPMAGQLATGDLTGKAVAHTSGAHDASSLAALADCGAMTGSLHPAYPFADVETALAGLAGATFAVEAEMPLLVDWLGDIARALNGHILNIPPGSKAIYHAALVLVSNYTVTLYAAAERLLATMTDDQVTVDGALNALLGATAANLQATGIPDALTGPLVRGDAGTIAAHLDALRQQDAQLAQAYCELARLTLPILHARGVATGALEQVLEQGLEDATDDT